MHNIFIIDDDRPSRILIREIVRNEDISSIEAANGYEAIAKFDMYKNNIELILLDIHLPGISGFELLKHFRSVAPDIPVIAISAVPSADIQDECLQAGFDQFISKPFNFTEFSSILENFLSYSM